jgi:hypothetical protein
MVNTGTWNSDLALLFVGMFFLPIFLYMVMGVILRAKEFSEKSYIINVYEEAPKPKKVKIQKPKKSQKPKSQKPKKSQKQAKPKDAWDSGMVSEAVGSLANLGYKKSEARRIVSQLCSSKSYKKAEDIIIDAMQKCV